ncbi:MAG: hypothetical protein AAF810_01500 [Cyanobacteria bacterium P01_D01_bin.36]
MRTQNLLAAIGLVSILGACVTPSTSLSDRGDGTATSPALSSGTSSAAACELTDSQLDPLSTAENTPVFEQFNFRPLEISTGGNSVTITTAHHIFSLCETNGQWSIASAKAAEDEEPFNYEQLLAEIADPNYETVELGGESYEYRIRLQANWLTEQLKPETTNPEAISSDSEETEAPATATEDAVFFELKTPDGELIIQQLYTVSELRSAGLGASLGEPSIVGAIAAGADLWFAATASQGEGNSGFASLIQYSSQTQELTVERPESLQGDQLTSLAITGSAEGDSDQPLTLWIGTQRSGEGNPYFPADGLVSYQPSDNKLTTHTTTNSPLVGAIPHRLAVEEDTLWVATGDGLCQVDWQTAESPDGWSCWRFTATADIPSEGVDLYSSFLATEPAAELKDESVEVLWVSQSYDVPEDEPFVRYEVAYAPGFETQLSQGGYRITNEVAQRAAGGTDLFWPGTQWHWTGEQFARSLDEVSLNLVGGGPRGLVAADRRGGFDFDNYAIRGDFDLLALTDDATKVRYYSGWINGEAVTVYPTVVPVDSAAADEENPLTEMAAKLTSTQGP